eukprot:9510946-Ditylum_brightwellii.AAC.2
MSKDNAFNGKFAQSPTDNNNRQDSLYDEDFQFNNGAVDFDDSIDGGMLESDFESLNDGRTDTD